MARQMTDREKFMRPVGRGATFAERGIAPPRAVQTMRTQQPQQAPQQLITKEEARGMGMGWQARMSANDQILKNRGGEQKQRLSNQGSFATQAMQNEGSIADIQQRNIGASRLQGSQQIHETSLLSSKNKAAQALATKQGQIAADAAERQNTWTKEGDNRKFGADFIMRGGQGSPQVNNLYNTPGTSDVDVAGLQIPQKREEPKQTYVQPKFDDDGVMRPGTGMWTSPPTVGGVMGGGQQQGGLSKDFNPSDPSPEDAAYLRSLAASGQFDLLRQIEQQYLPPGR